MRSRTLLHALVTLALTAGALEAAARIACAIPAFRHRLSGDLAGRRAVSLLAASDSAVANTDPRGPGVAALGRRVVHHPVLGWRNAPGVWEVAGLPTTVDADGHRTTGPATAGPRTVLVAGDSFAFGDEVSDAEAWPALLSAHTGARVVNTGTPSWGLDQVVLALEMDRPAVRPDVVLLGLTPACIARTAISWDAWAKPWFRLEGGELKLQGVPVPTPAMAVAAMPRSRATLLLGVAWDRVMDPWDDTATVSRTGLLLDLALSQAGPTPLRVVWLPDPADPSRPSSARRAYETWCIDHVSTCVDAAPALRALVGPLRRGVHYTPEAHAAVATLMAEALPR